MDFLALFVMYLLLVLASIILVCIYSGRKQSFPARGLSCITQVFSFIIPTWLQRATKRVLHRLVHTRSCLFIVLHLALQVAVYGEYTWEVFGYCLELEFSIHFLLLPYLLLAVNMGFFILCSVTNPGTIMQSNQESFLKAYAYDGVMFQKSTMCPTCNVEKPARSKHCRRSQTKFVSNIAMLPLYYSTGVYQICVCNSCVHRFDHHCVWVNNCIGAFNTRYFLVYLFTLTAMAADIATITATFLIHVVLLSNMMLGSYIDDQGQEHTVEILFLIQHLFLTFPRIVFMLGFVIVLFLVLGAYCCFTLYLALTNQTSNEWYKSRRYDCSCCRTLQPHDRHVYRNVYSQGIWVNLKEIFKPLTNTEKKKKT